jgi:hypothetical protein
MGDSPRIFVVRVMVDVERRPNEVVAAYRTSKMEKYWRSEVMKVSCDPGTDTLSMILKEGVQVFESDEDEPGVILNYDESTESHRYGLG